MSDQLRLAMLISGGGTTMQAIIRAVKSGRLAGIKPVCVIASTPEANGIDKALAEGIPAQDVKVIRPNKKPSKILCVGKS